MRASSALVKIDDVSIAKFQGVVELKDFKSATKNVTPMPPALINYPCTCD
jgi:hypothetical protein